MFSPPLRRVWPRSPVAERRTLGWQACDFAAEMLGIELLGWEQWFLVHLLELRPDGRLRYRTAVLLVARQNGKTTISVVLALFAMFVLGRPLVIGTAQDLDVAEVAWQGAVDMVEGNAQLAEMIDRVVRVNGKKALELKSGERYKVKAANAKAARGLSGDLVLLDELRSHKSWDAWSAITHTTMARPDALILGISNAGDASSVVLRHLRLTAHRQLGNPDGLDLSALTVPPDGDDEQVGLFEWSARPDRDGWDRDGWAEANPALGRLITERAIVAQATSTPAEQFRAEVLCQWSDASAAGPFPLGAWDACRTDVAWDGGEMAVAVDVSWDRSWTHVAMAGRRGDGRTHVEVMVHAAGTGWVRGWLFERGHRRVVCQRGAPVASLVDEFAELAPDGKPWVEVVDWSGADLGAACGAFHDLVVSRQVTHLDQPVLDVAAGAAVKKPLANDAWAWDRKRSPVDVAPLVAVTGAVWGLSRPVKLPPEPALLIL